MHRITPPPADELEQMYADRSLDELSGLLCVSVGTVRTWVHDAGIPMRPKGGIPGRFKVADVKTEDLVQAFRNGMNYSEIADHFHISRPAVVYRLKQAEIELPERKHKVELDWNEIERLYVDVSGEVIAKQFKVSPGVIYRALDKRGVPLRHRTAHMKAWHA